MKSTKPKPISISDIIKKGSSEGNKMLSHINMPSLALFKESDGLRTTLISRMMIINKKNNFSNYLVSSDFEFIFIPPIDNTMRG